MPLVWSCLHEAALTLLGARVKVQSLKSLVIEAAAVCAALLFCLLILAGLANGSYVGALIALLGALYCFPRTHRALVERSDYEMTGRGALIVGGALLVASLAFTGVAIYQEALRANAEAERIADITAKKAAAQEARNQRFLTNKASELQQARTSLAAMDDKPARQLLTEVRLEDVELKALAREVDAFDVRRQLKDESDLPMSRQVALYNSLAQLEPSNREVVDKAAKLSAAFERSQKEAKAAEARAKQIEAQFSSWDGSHRNVVRAVQERMNDPDSFKHVKTRYKETPTGLIVFMTYRGTNKFGGVVTGTVMATVDKTGDVLTLANVD